MNKCAVVVVGIVVASLCAVGCVRWPRISASPLPMVGGHYKSQPGRPRAGQHGKVAAPVLVGFRHLNDPNDPSLNATLIKLKYPNGNWCNLLIGGSEVDISPLDAGAGIELSSGWVYVHGKFPSTVMTGGQKSDNPMWSIWPIVLRSSIAAGAEGTTFIVDARYLTELRVTTLADADGGESHVNLWDITKGLGGAKPLDPPNDPATGRYVVPAGFTAFVDQPPTAPPAPKQLLARADVDSVYGKFLKSVEDLAAAYGADVP